MANNSIPIFNFDLRYKIIKIADIIIHQKTLVASPKCKNTVSNTNNQGQGYKTDETNDNNPQCSYFYEEQLVYI